jgi:hypothetical protein
VQGNDETGCPLLANGGDWKGHMLAALICANCTLAMVARLHRIQQLQPVWTPLADDKVALSVAYNGRSARTVLDAEALRRAFDGDEGVQRRLVRAFAGLLKSIKQCL